MKIWNFLGFIIIDYLYQCCEGITAQAVQAMATAVEAETATTNIIFNCQIKRKRIYGCKLILIFAVGIGKLFAKSFRPRRVYNLNMKSKCAEMRRGSERM